MFSPVMGTTQQDVGRHLLGCTPLGQHAGQLTGLCLHSKGRQAGRAAAWALPAAWSTAGIAVASGQHDIKNRAGAEGNPGCKQPGVGAG